MKKIFVTLLLLSGASSLFAAIDGKFGEGYEYKSLELNTAQKEHSMSLYGDSSVIFLRDGQVYIADVDTASTGLVNERAEESLTKLGIRGTVAYDKENSTIYYSLVEDDKNEWLYSSSLKEDGSWSKPERLVIDGLGKSRTGGTFLSNAGWGYVVKPEVIMQNPTMNGGRIYFSSASEDIEGGRGGKDIWYIEPLDNEKWAYPVNAGDSINSEADEDFPFFDVDGTMYFASNRDGSNMSIYSASDSLAEEMPVPYNSFMGNYNFIVKDGVPFSISNRSGNDNIFAFVKLPEVKPVVLTDTVKNEIEVLEPIIIKFPWTFLLFDFDKYNVTERYLREIEAMAIVMNNETPEGVHYVIEGHTDQRGSDAYNQVLSEKRANTVKEHLIEQGVNPDLLEAIGYGESRPLFANPQNEDEFYQNRRVVVNMVNEKGEIVTSEMLEAERAAKIEAEKAAEAAESETPENNE